jgi:hypothetical protein
MLLPALPAFNMASVACNHYRKWTMCLFFDNYTRQNNIIDALAEAVAEAETV